MRVLRIDLTTGRSAVNERPDLDRWIGGTGLATALFLEEFRRDIPPGDPAQPVVIAAGFLAPYFPAATKSVAVFFSPLTRNIGESHAGGRLALALKLAGLDACVITGVSDAPCYVSVSDGDVAVHSAWHLQGLKATETATFIREKEKRPGFRSILRTGPCGENGTAFSMVVVDTYRHFGRLGMGAVFGAKRMKALVVTGSGERSPAPADPAEYRKQFEELHNRVTSQGMRKYHEYGTALNVLPLNEMRGLPVRNLAAASYDGAEGISGESFAAGDLTRKFACAGCPVGCIHIATIRRKFGAEEEWERADVSYDYELIYALGSLLGIGNRSGVLDLIEKVEELGLDAIYAGVFLAWLTEAWEKGLVSEGETDCGPIAFGDAAGYLAVLDNLARSSGEFYRIGRAGLEALCARYGGAEFALLAGGNAIAGYHTGYANLIGQHLVGVRNAHTDNAGYALDQESRTLSPEETVDRLLGEELFRSAFNCTGLCLFVRKIYDFPTIRSAAATLGTILDEAAFRRLGEEIYLKKMRFKVQCGFAPEAIRVPARFFETPACGATLDRAFIERACGYFAERIRGMGEGGEE